MSSKSCGAASRPFSLSCGLDVAEAHKSKTMAFASVLGGLREDEGGWGKGFGRRRREVRTSRSRSRLLRRAYVVSER